MSDIAATIEKFKATKADMDARIKAIRDEAKGESQKTMKSVFDDFFAKHPTVYGIGWAQYTPYFADGDPCEFGVNEPGLFITEDGFEEEGFHGGQHNLEKTRAYYAGRGRDAGRVAETDALIESFGGLEAYRRIRDDFRVVETFLEAVGEENLEMIYGDHVSVLYRPDGVTVEEYDHD